MGTLNILAACSAPDSPVRKLVFKSSAHYYGTALEDPAFFTEDMRRNHAPQTPLKRDIVEAETAVEDFRDKNPDVTVTRMRFCNVLGPDILTSHARLLSLPAVPMIAGFDPRYQFIHADDVVGALEFAVEHDLPGIYNVAPDGVLALSEMIGLLGKHALPVLPPWGTGAGSLAAEAGGIPATARDAAAAALRPRAGQPQAEGRRIHLPLHDPRDRAGVRRASAPEVRAEGGPGALPVREGGRGLPALEPERARARG